jgi:hypothetical protein
MCEEAYEVVNLVQLIIVGCSGEFYEHSYKVLGTEKREFWYCFVNVSLFVCVKSVGLNL